MAIISERIEGKLITVDVKSSNIKTAVYDTVESLLTITFNNGTIYEYSNFPWELFTKFRMSESQGKYFMANINNKYNFKKVG